jgi:hypothetical protein
MLDPCFKNLQLIQDYVGLEVVMAIAAKYDHTILMPLFLTIYNSLTLKPITIEPLDLNTPELGVFGSMASTKEVAMGLFRVELSLYRQITMPTETFNPFNWWAEHEQQFPNKFFGKIDFQSCRFTN